MRIRPFRRIGEARLPRWAAVLARAGAAVLLLAFALRRVDVAVLAATLREVPAWGLALPLLLLLNSGVSAWRIRVLMPSPRPAMRDVLQAVLLGNFVGLALPTGGGEAAKAVALGRLAGRGGVGVSVPLTCLATARVLELGPWGGLVFWAAVGVLPGRLDAWVPLAWGVGGAMWGVLAAAGLWWWWWRMPYRPGARGILGCALGALPFAAINCGVVWGLLHALRAAVSIGDVLGLIPAVDVLIALPVTVAGVGVREAMFTTGLAPWHVTAETALAVAWLRWSGEVARALVGGAWWMATASAKPPPVAA